MRVRFDICDEHFYSCVLLDCSSICYRIFISPPWEMQSDSLSSAGLINEAA